MKKQTIGMKIASLRREKGMTQLELAVAILALTSAFFCWLKMVGM